MFCEKCGNQIPEDVKVCPSCGQVMDDIAQDAESEIFANSNEEIETENNDANDFANPSFETVEAPKKSKKKLIVSVIAIVLVVAIVLTAVFNFDYFKGFYLKTFGSDVEYYTYVEKKALADAKNSIVKYYGTYTENVASGKTATKGSVKFKVGDELKTLGPMFGIDDATVESFENIEFNIFANQHEDLSSVKMGLVLSDTTILSAELIMDLISEEMYVSIPELSKSYLKIAAGYDAIYGEDATAMSSMLTNKELIAALPDESALDRVLDKCIDAILDSVNNVKSGTETVKSEGFSQELTVLECKINEETALQMVENVLKVLRNDADVKAAIYTIKEYGVENELCEKDDDIYGEFQEGIDDLLKEIKESKKEVDKDGEAIVITTYVDSNHEIVGRKIVFDDEEVLNYYKLHDGNKFVTMIDVADTLKITGTGTENGDTINGEYSMEVDGEKYITVAASDFEISDNITKGKIKITPNKALYDLFLGSSGSSMISLYDPAIELVFDSDEDFSKTELNLIVKNSMLIGFEISAEQIEASKITLPENSIDITDTEALQEWALNIDVSTIKKNLEKAGVPVDLLDQLLGELTEQNVQTEEYYDDYYDYYY